VGRAGREEPRLQGRLRLGGGVEGEERGVGMAMRFRCTAAWCAIAERPTGCALAPRPFLLDPNVTSHRYQSGPKTRSRFRYSALGMQPLQRGADNFLRLRVMYYLSASSSRPVTQAETASPRAIPASARR
jgi:hypothetical protein